MYQILRLLGPRHTIHLLAFAHSIIGLQPVEHALAPLSEFCTVETVPPPAHTPERRLRALLLSADPDMVLRGKDPRFAERLRDVLAREHFDVVQAESIEMAQYTALLSDRGATAPRASPAPLRCYDAWNAEYHLQRRASLTALRRLHTWPIAAYSFIQWRKLRRYETSLRGRFDLAFAVSEADRRTLASLSGGLPVEVVPNGVDTQFFRRAAVEPVQDGPSGTPYLLFTGTLDFRPNVDAILWFVRSVWEPLRALHPGLRLCIVGQRPVEAIRRLAGVVGVQVIGTVPDVRPWFAGARAYVLPMRVGGGVRLKLLEAWAMGLPCITTSLGAEGVPEFRADEHALVADGAVAFGQAVERVLQDDALAARLGAAGRRLVEQRYDWRPIMERMEEAWTARLARV